VAKNVFFLEYVDMKKKVFQEPLYRNTLQL